MVRSWVSLLKYEVRKGLPVSASGVLNPSGPQSFAKNVLMNDAAMA